MTEKQGETLGPRPKKQKKAAQASAADATVVAKPQTPTPKAPPRRMIPVLPPFPTAKSSTPLKSFTIMTYNILAQCLVRRDLFPYCGPADLKGATRFPMILDEITRQHKPDIACLQEVDNFEKLIVPGLRNAGYDWVYLRKDPAKEGGHGLCIAWKKDKFSKVQYESVLYDKSPLTHPTPVTPITNNIAQLIALKFNCSDTATDADPYAEEAMDEEELKAARQREAAADIGVVIGNTHLFWRPQAQYEKLRQAYVYLEEAIRFRKGLEREQDMAGLADVKRKKWPLFLCGDWNSSPNDGVYRTLTRQPLTEIQRERLAPVAWAKPAEKPAEGDAKNEAASEPIENPIPIDILLHKFSALPPLHSAYSTYRTSDPSHTVNPDWKDTVTESGDPVWDGEPTYTNYAIWKGTLDYIFAAEEGDGYESLGYPDGDEGRPSERDVCGVQVSHVLDIPQSQYLVPGIPNVNFPSDHVCLMARVDVSSG
ncbi:hypothetical protein HDV00_011467 [Rhizophlyctis rosea]|nr:hypothetical protein HDV00_011467 [Rhizophlyctis rosea]